MARRKGDHLKPFRDTTAFEFARHCVEKRGMTAAQVYARLIRLHGRLGTLGRERYLVRVNNILVRRRVLDDVSLGELIVCPRTGMVARGKPGQASTSFVSP